MARNETTEQYVARCKRELEEAKRQDATDRQLIADEIKRAVRCGGYIDMRTGKCREVGD